MRNFHRWRSSSAALALIMLASGTAAVYSDPAAATNLSGERATAATLYKQIQSIYGRINGLAQQYDLTQIKLDTIKRNITFTENAVSGIGRDLARGNTQLRTDVIFAYVTNGATVGSDPLFTSSPAKSGATNIYSQLAEGNIGTALERLKGYRIQLTQEHSILAGEDHRAARQVATASNSMRVAQNLEKTLQHSLRRVKGRIASYFRQRQAAAAADALRALQAARALRAAQAMQATRALEAARAIGAGNAKSTNAPSPTDSRSTSTSPSTSVPLPTSVPPSAAPAPLIPAPPPDPRANIAIQAAMGLIGVPYVWGGASPSGVDCSGLVMLAYQAAGIYLPHYSGAQFLDTIRVPLYDIQPGDILFYGYQGDTHEAIYIGDGKMIQAEETGTLVQITPIWLGDSSLPLAGIGRPRA